MAAWPTRGGGGFLGVEYNPLEIRNPNNPPNDSQLRTSVDRYQRRLKLLGNLQQGYAAGAGAQVVEDQRQLVRQASEMILSPQMESFDISLESAASREFYGSGNFASGCLLARRLVEQGVTFVEVVSNGWDTHQDNFERSANLCGQIDQPTAALIADLKRRGMLEKTLVVWMGEFGRTPNINPRAGRDHFPRAFNAMLAGGGVQGGQVIGSTDAAGKQVVQRPVTVHDLFRTIYHTLGIDADTENMSRIGRPIKLVDGGQVVEELLA